MHEIHAAFFNEKITINHGTKYGTIFMFLFFVFISTFSIIAIFVPVKYPVIILGNNFYRQQRKIPFDIFPQTHIKGQNRQPVY